jgi:hypothetical protein
LQAPSPRLASIDRRQLLLRTVDAERLIDEDHSARSIWELVGRLELSLYYAQIEAVEGQAGRDHTDPQLLMISLWLYAYSRGISSAREGWIVVGLGGLHLLRPENENVACALVAVRMRPHHCHASSQ